MHDRYDISVMKSEWFLVEILSVQFGETFFASFDALTRDHSASVQSLADPPSTFPCIATGALHPYLWICQSLKFVFVTFSSAHPASSSTSIFQSSSKPPSPRAGPLCIPCRTSWSICASKSRGFVLSQHSRMMNLMKFFLFSPILSVCTSLAALTECWSGTGDISISSRRSSRHTSVLKARFSCFVLANHHLSHGQPHASGTRLNPTSTRRENAAEEMMWENTHTPQGDQPQTQEQGNHKPTQTHPLRERKCVFLIRPIKCFTFLWKMVRHPNWLLVFFRKNTFPKTIMEIVEEFEKQKKTTTTPGNRRGLCVWSQNLGNLQRFRIFMFFILLFSFVFLMFLSYCFFHVFIFLFLVAKKIVEKFLLEK